MEINVPIVDETEASVLRFTFADVSPSFHVDGKQVGEIRCSGFGVEVHVEDGNKKYFIKHEEIFQAVLKAKEEAEKDS